ncbi:MAG: carboxypeptidase-like regulatory domain-containing protein [Bacteroidales bacterium]|nr:carboxypeptidase-like regulatory domain-containing protein [Bacteroidales bacterium]
MKKIVTKTIVLFGLIFFMNSCEGYRWAKGTIYDFNTEEPIEGVLCIVKSGRQEQYSDSLGRYDVHNSLGGCMFGCKDIVVEFSKTGYKTKTETNPKDIFLEKE